MKKILIAFIALFSALWALDAFMHPIAGGDLLWQWRNYLLYYTGVVSFALIGIRNAFSDTSCMGGALGRGYGSGLSAA